MGEESTVDETFSYSEQSLIKTFLQQGGRLIVSGAEIAWDLDYKGSATDKDFYYNFLKAKYRYDAPGNQSGIYYSAAGSPDSSDFGDLNTFNFDISRPHLGFQRLPLLHISAHLSHECLYIAMSLPIIKVSFWQVSSVPGLSYCDAITIAYFLVQARKSL